MIDDIEKYIQDDDALKSKGYFLMLKAKSLLNIGDIYNAYITAKESCEIAQKLKWDKKIESSLKSGIMIEASRIFILISHIEGETIEDHKYKMTFKDLGLQLCEELIENYELGNYSDIDHYRGAKANKARILLNEEQKKDNEAGIDELKESINRKIRDGNWHGVTSDYCGLGLHYLKEKDFKQAIAYTKKDLFLTQKYGSKRDEISTLLNLSDIYFSAKQISKAKKTLTNAKLIAVETGNHAALSKIEKKQELIKRKVIEYKENGIGFGTKCICECGSGSIYDGCCGKADYNLHSIRDVLGFDKLFLFTEFEESNMAHVQDSSELDLIMKKYDKDKTRLSWAKMHKKGQYEEVFELPDMASIHLKSAEIQLKNIDSDSLLDETSVSLSVLMLSFSALEAFLNQLTYFLATLGEGKLPQYIYNNIPSEITSDCYGYQRNTRFADKLYDISNLFSNGKWNSDLGEMYKDIYDLIEVRNELVHFKSSDYIQIIPPVEHNLLKKINKKIVTRDISNSWPMKLLNKDFAIWSYDTVNNVINFIKDEYQKGMD